MYHENKTPKRIVTVTCTNGHKFKFEHSHTKHSKKLKNQKFSYHFPLLQTPIISCCKKSYSVAVTQDFPGCQTLRSSISMEEIPFNTFHQHPETLGPDSSVSRAFDWEKVEPLSQESKDSAMNDESDESLVDSMLCDSRSRLIPSGFTKSNSTG